MQALIAELFQTTPQNVTMHLQAIFEEGELVEEATCKELLQVRREGSREVARNLRHYGVEAILAVGYRFRSQRGTQFRQWATARLSEYHVKGHAIDDERRKNPPALGTSTTSTSSSPAFATSARASGASPCACGRFLRPEESDACRSPRRCLSWCEPARRRASPAR